VNFFSFFLFLIILLSLCLGAACFYLIKFAKIIFIVEDAINESIIILNASQNQITLILETPIFFDSSEIRRALQEIERSRDSIITVAEKISLGQLQVEMEEDEL
jgi:hypothetical protein